MVSQGLARPFTHIHLPPLPLLPGTGIQVQASFQRAVVGKPFPRPPPSPASSLQSTPLVPQPQGSHLEKLTLVKSSPQSAAATPVRRLLPGAHPAELLRPPSGLSDQNMTHKRSRKISPLSGAPAAVAPRSVLVTQTGAGTHKYTQCLMSSGFRWQELCPVPIFFRGHRALPLVQPKPSLH